ncbi:hypothetical protein [Chitinophaga skermanii]|uniref:hypothetical protein n=1 Tax=Chitinophaga skermanii TaxID=331697 RepID=UPI000DBA627B|nr:hypothetical protein [Chitinophaga skermanii]
MRKSILLLSCLFTACQTTTLTETAQTDSFIASINDSAIIDTSLNLLHTVDPKKIQQDSSLSETYSYDGIAYDTTELDIIITPFLELPPEIEGASELYAEDSTMLGRSEYLLAGNLEGVIFMRINGRLERLVAVKQEEYVEGAPRLFRNNMYELLIEDDELVQQVDYVIYRFVNVTVSSKRKKITTRLYGEIGC